MQNAKPRDRPRGSLSLVIRLIKLTVNSAL